jgi:NitT/TauT family transport system substrate-binding protein
MTTRLFAILALALGLTLGAGMPAAPAFAEDQVTVQLDWVVRGDHSIFFVGRDKGFFKKHGIDVTAILKGTGTPNALRLVGNGNADFGFGDLPTLAVAHSEGVPSVAIVAVNERSPLAIISLKKNHVLHKPADLKGLNIGIHPAGSTYVFFKAFLKANGMTEADMKESTVSPPYENYLLLGRVDVIVGYLDAEVPELEAKAGGPGSLSILQGADYGWKVLGSGLFTSEKMIKEKPDVVKRFVAGYMEAFHYVIAHPKEAVDITAAANPEYADKKDVLMAQLESDIKSTFSDADSKAHGLGFMTKARWEATLKTLTDQGVLKTPVKAEDVYSDKFLPAAH